MKLYNVKFRRKKPVFSLFKKIYGINLKSSLLTCYRLGLGLHLKGIKLNGQQCIKIIEYFRFYSKHKKLEITLKKFKKDRLDILKFINNFKYIKRHKLSLNSKRRRK